jgi:hypothetical protein
LAVSFANSFSAALAAPQPQPAVREAGIRQLENSWAQLDQNLRLLDQMLRPKPPGPQPPPSALALPTAASLGQGSVQSISLHQAPW